MCCGQKRSALRNAPAPPVARAIRQGAPISVSRPTPISQPVPAARQNVSAGMPGPVAAAPRIPNPHAAVTLHYLASSPIRVRGPATGRQYEFSGSRPLQAVDSRDASALLRTNFFRTSQ